MCSEWNWDIRRTVKAQDNASVIGILEPLLWAAAQLMEDANVSCWVQTRFIFMMAVDPGDVQRDRLRTTYGHGSIGAQRKKETYWGIGFVTLYCDMAGGFLWIVAKRNLLPRRYSNHYELLSWKKPRWGWLSLPVIVLKMAVVQRQNGTQPLINTSFTAVGLY